MRYVIFGAGAIGSGIGGRLYEHGHDVTLIARGAHLDAMRSGGLVLEAPGGTTTVRAPVVGHPDDAGIESGDRVILTMKGQDTPDALAVLERAVIGRDVAVLCAQNGVDNERQALRRFRDVYAICVMMPAAMLEPGVVQLNGAPRTGILDLGRYPDGVDDTAESVAADLESAGFASRPEARPMRLKYCKLLMNLANALEGAIGTVDRTSDLYLRARAEGVACLTADGADWASEEEDRARRDGLLSMTPIAGRPRRGGSTWQSLARGTGTVEADSLNGEIVLLGRLHGIPTPVNELLQRTAHELAAAGAPPGSLSANELRDRLDAVSA
jgi:2-dehydropantoate 2-reductase